MEVNILAVDFNSGQLKKLTLLPLGMWRYISINSPMIYPTDPAAKFIAWSVAQFSACRCMPDTPLYALSKSRPQVTTDSHS